MLGEEETSYRNRRGENGTFLTSYYYVRGGK